MNIFSDKSHKEDRNHQPLNTLTTKKQDILSKNQKKYEKKNVIIVRHINISLRILFMK